MTLTTVAPVLTKTGVIAPTYYEIVEYFKEKYREIYGDDAYLESDSQDGQWIGIVSSAIAECGAACVSVYSTFSPKTAVGEALSRNVAINGIARALATYSYVDLLITGIAGTEIKNGFAMDTGNNKWIFPELVLIPEDGNTSITARSEKIGSVFAQIGNVNKVGKPTRGWHSVTNQTTSQPGVSTESDLKLRQRQALSVAIPSQSKIDGIKGALFGLSGVSRCKTYENNEGEMDGLGLPPHSVCIVVSGGDAIEIAQIMRAKKSMGCKYFGNTQISVQNTFNEPEQISFYRPHVVDIGFQINMQASAGYTNEIGVNVKQAISDYINQLDIGDRVTLNKVYIPAGLYGNLDSMTYEILSIAIIANGVEIDGDYKLMFNEVAYCDTDNISINISGGA